MVIGRREADVECAESCLYVRGAGIRVAGTGGGPWRKAAMIAPGGSEWDGPAIAVGMDG